MSKVIADLAQRQHGVVTREQARALGVTDRSVERSVEAGRLVALHRGVYAWAGTADSFERRIMAGVFAAGPRAVASHRAAAHLLRIGEVAPVVEVSVPRARRPRVPGLQVYRAAFLPGWQRLTVGPVPVTSPARTICDLAMIFDPDPVELVLDHGLARRRFTVADVRRVLRKLPHRRGGRRLAALLDARSEGRALVESPLEQRLHRVLREAGILEWERQLWITVPGGRYRADVAFPQARLIIEVDSYLHHSSRTDWAKDHVRHADLAVAGWRVLRVTREDLREGRAAFVDRVRAALSLDLGQLTTL